MKNLIKLLGIILIVVIIGFSMAACGDNNDDNGDNNNNNGKDNDGNSGFTLTDIPSEYNGKYAFLQGTSDYFCLLGVNSINLSSGARQTALISNGRVNLELYSTVMWAASEDPPKSWWDSFVKYSGNNTFVIYFYITDKQSFDFDQWIIIADSDDPVIALYPVTFSKGNATKSWNDQYIFDDYDDDD
jgi:hypothetical protein